MERPIFKPLGTPVKELDTPALVIDLAVLERNIETLHAFFREGETKVRPHVESHRCPEIARLQLAAGGTAGGICTTTVGEAEVFAEHGFTDLLVANEVVAPPKIRRLSDLARRAHVTVAVDNPKNVQDLSQAMVGSGVTLNVVVDISVRSDRCGVEPGEAALDLARTVATAQGLRFVGLISGNGGVPSEDPDETAARSRKWLQQVLDTREKIERAGFEVEVVSVGGTADYETAGAMTGVTELLAGSYALSDYKQWQDGGRFQPAARVMATVTSRPEPGAAITDCGQKAIGSDYGLPAVEDVSGAKVASLSAEHGRLHLEGDADGRVDLGDKVWLTPWDIGTCVNLYDYIRAVRDGKLEAVWSVAARGQYR